MTNASFLPNEQMACCMVCDFKMYLAVVAHKGSCARNPMLSYIFLSEENNGRKLLLVYGFIVFLSNK